MNQDLEHAFQRLEQNASPVAFWDYARQVVALAQSNALPLIEAGLALSSCLSLPLEDSDCLDAMLTASMLEFAEQQPADDTQRYWRSLKRLVADHPPAQRANP